MQIAMCKCVIGMAILQILIQIRTLLVNATTNRTQMHNNNNNNNNDEYNVNT